MKFLRFWIIDVLIGLILCFIVGNVLFLVYCLPLSWFDFMRAILNKYWQRITIPDNK